jgi:hypothetical protein
MDMIARLEAVGYAAHVAPSDGPVRRFRDGDRNAYVNVFFVSADNPPPELVQ